MINIKQLKNIKDTLDNLSNDVEELKSISNKRYQTLWTGTWTSGKITVPNANKYHSFLVTIENNNVSGLFPGQKKFMCYKTTRNNTDMIYGFCADKKNISSDPGALTEYMSIICSLWASYSGNEWTIKNNSVLYSSLDSGYQSLPTFKIKEIVGVDPIIET